MPCLASADRFGNGLLEQETDGHGCRVERGAGWSGQSRLIWLSGADVASCAEIVKGVGLLLRLALLGWRAGR